MSVHEDWERLVEALDTWGSAVAIAPGRIEVSLPPEGSGRRVVVVMTPDEWDDMTDVMWGGDVADAVDDVKRTLLALSPHQVFAVYSDYRLAPSAEPTLGGPPDAAPAEGGQWVAYDKEGRMASRFADWSEPSEPDRDDG